MKSILIAASLIGITACAPLASRPADTLPPPPDTISHRLAPASKVIPIDNEWSEYINVDLGISIRFPRQVLQDSPFIRDTENPIVPVYVVEQGEVVTFARDRNPTWAYDGFPPETYVDADISVRHPYYSPEYINEDPRYQWQMYVAKADTIEDVNAFIRRAYGDGCDRVTEEHGSRYDDRPGTLTFTVSPDAPDCPGWYPLGGVVTWYQHKNVVVGIQPGWTGHLTKPYYVDPSGSEADYYEFQVNFIES